MTSSYAKFRERDSIPTSHVRIKHEEFDSTTDLILLEDGNQRGIFEVEVEDSDLFDLDSNLVYGHENIRELFPNLSGPSANNRVTVKEVSSQSDLQLADAAKVVHIEGGENALKSYLNSGNRLVHPITEVHSYQGSELVFKVVGTNPGQSPSQTFVIDGDSTEVEIVSKAEYQSSIADSSSEDQATEDDEIGEQPYTIEAPEESFDDVAGLPDVKKHATALIELYKGNAYDKLTSNYSEDLISREDTILLYGPPGCGKTMVSEAIANEFQTELTRNVVFMRVKGSDILSKMKGESEKKVREIFSDARDMAAGDGFAVLFFDEIENLVFDRSSDSIQSHQVSLTNAFLQEMNDIANNLMVIGATNMPFKMDSAASRRFHTKLFIPHPGPDAMAEVWKNNLEDVQQKKNIDYDELGENSVNFTPAEVDDQILGSTVQTEIIESYLNGDPKTITNDYLMVKLNEAEPRSVSEYVSKVKEQMRRNKMEGYDELRDYVQKNV